MSTVNSFYAREMYAENLREDHYEVSVSGGQVRHLVFGDLDQVIAPWRDAAHTVCGRDLVPLNYYRDSEIGATCASCIKALTS